jgi:hypothetical protein
MKIEKYLILILFSLLSSQFLYGSPADTTSIIDNIYNYDFLKATARLSELSEKDPLKSQALNLEVKWWMAMENKETDKFNGFLKTLNHYEETETSELSLLISSTYRMRYYACTNREYLIPFLFIKIRRQLNNTEKSIMKTSSVEDHDLFVLYKSFLGLIQNSYSVSGYFNGNEIQEGLINKIESLIRNGSYSNRTVGRYFLMKYYLDIEKNKPKALTYLTELHLQYPKNQIFSQLLTNK